MVSIRVGKFPFLSNLTAMAVQNMEDGFGDTYLKIETEKQRHRLEFIDCSL